MLSVLFGPAGLFYSSVNTALVLTLLTLTGVLTFSEYTLYVLVGSFTMAILCGWLLVQSHNKHVNVRDFTFSTYIGRVSCKVIGKSRFKRDYSRPLARAKFKRKLRTTLTFTLASLCLIVTGLIAIPNALNQISTIQNSVVVNGHSDPSNNEDTLESTVPQIAAAFDEQELSSIGIWQIKSQHEEDEFHAHLKGNRFQNTSEGYYRPTLTLSCISGNPTISFEAFEVLGTEKTQLTLLFDARPQESYKWRLHSDYRSAYSTATNSLLSKLSKAEDLQISYLPFGSIERKSIEFTLGKSSVITRKLKRQCA